MEQIGKTSVANRIVWIHHALLILPAIALGVLAMIQNGISPALWGQQLAAWILFALLAVPLRRITGQIPAAVWAILCLIALTATLFQHELDGIRRWLDLGIFSANAAMLVLPTLLSVLPQFKYPHPVILLAAAVLSLQPDLSQLTAFCLAVLPLLWQHKEKRLWTLGSLLAALVLETICLFQPTTIQSIPYCEGILAMLCGMSRLLLWAGCAALAAIPAYFALCYVKHGSPRLLSLSIYYAVTMLFSLSGLYPVPFMGFGLSPIIGYYFAYICAS